MSGRHFGCWGRILGAMPDLGGDVGQLFWCETTRYVPSCCCCAIWGSRKPAMLRAPAPAAATAAALIAVLAALAAYSRALAATLPANTPPATPQVLMAPGERLCPPPTHRAADRRQTLRWGRAVATRLRFQGDARCCGLAPVLPWCRTAPHSTAPRYQCWQVRPPRRPGPAPPPHRHHVWAAHRRLSKSGSKTYASTGP